MAIKLEDLDQILGYDPGTHTVNGFPSLHPDSPMRSTPAPIKPMGATAAPAAPAAMRSMAPGTMNPVKQNDMALDMATSGMRTAHPTMPTMPAAGAAAAPAATAPGAPALAPMGAGAAAAPESLPGSMPTLAKPKGPGFLSKFGHGLAEAGQIAGNIFAPGEMMNIPGTQLNKEWNQKREAALGAENAETGFRNAQTGETQANTWKALHPGEAATQASQAEMDFRKGAAEKIGLQPGTFPYQQYIATGQMTQQTGKTPEEQVYASEVAAGKSPADAYAAVEQMKTGAQGANQPLGDVAGANKQMTDRYQVLNPGKPLPAEFTLPANATKADFDRVDKALGGIEGAQGAKSARDSAEADRNLARQDRESQQQTKQVQKASDDLQKSYVKPADDIERSYRMFQDAYNAIQRGDAKTGAEDMLLLSQHLGTTFGQVKGSRMNKDLIQEHKDAIGIQDKIERYANSLASGQQLSPDQRKEFGDLIGNMRNLTWQAVAHEASRSKVPIDMLPSDARIKMADGKGTVRQIPGDQVQDYLDKGAKVAY
jgi:hypothetical protein